MGSAGRSAGIQEWVELNIVQWCIRNTPIPLDSVRMHQRATAASQDRKCAFFGGAVRRPDPQDQPALGELGFDFHRVMVRDRADEQGTQAGRDTAAEDGDADCGESVHPPGGGGDRPRAGEATDRER